MLTFSTSEDTKSLKIANVREIAIAYTIRRRNFDRIFGRFELIEFRNRNKKRSLSETSTLKIQTFPSVKITKRNQLKVRIFLNVHHYDKESRSSDV